MNFNPFPLTPKITAPNEYFRATNKLFKRSLNRSGSLDRREVRATSLLLNLSNSNSLLPAKPLNTNNNIQITTDIVQAPIDKKLPIPSPLGNTTVFPSPKQSNLVNSASSSLSQISHPFSKLYVFGDSLSDQGNIFNITSFANRLEPKISVIPSSPYFEGRFSNGPLWIDYLSAGLGLPLQVSTKLSIFSPSLPIPLPFTLVNGELRASPFFNGATTTQSVNFAFGGAQTGFNSGLAGTLSSLIPGVLQQVSWFINDHITAGKTADSNALYVVFAGANDYFDPSNALQPSQSVTNIALSIAALYSQGARDFVIPNLPDLGLTPRALRGGTQAETRLSDLAIAHNTLLNQALNGLANVLPQSNFIPLDFYGLFNNVAANPDQLGISNITDPSFESTTGTIVGDPNAHLFWDEIHPTALGHLGLGLSALVSVLNSTPQVNNLNVFDQILTLLGNQSNLDQALLPNVFAPTFNKTATLIEIPSKT